MKRYFQLSRKTIGVMLVLHSTLSKVTLTGIVGTAGSSTGSDDRLTRIIAITTAVIGVLREILYAIIKYTDPEAFTEK